MSQVIISIPENEYWAKMRKLVDTRIERLVELQKPKSLETYSINQVAKKLRRSHHTIKAMVGDGIFKTTPDSRILASEVEKYLKRVL